MDKLVITKIGKPEPWLIEAAADIGIDVSEFSHETTSEFLTHTFKRHGNDTTERARGQIGVTPADIERVPEIVKDPDYAVIGIKRKNETLIAYSKNFGGNATIYYEEILTGNKTKALRSKTMFIKIGSLKQETFLNILGSNVLTDISGAKIVVGTGGQPGVGA
jgi:hypothetical protein